MAYKVFREIEVGGEETQYGRERGRRKIILTAKQNSYLIPSGPWEGRAGLA